MARKLTPAQQAARKAVETRILNYYDMSEKERKAEDKKRSEAAKKAWRTRKIKARISRNAH